MALFHLTADDEILRPGIVVGLHPDTGVLHRLVIAGGDVTIERKDYVSDNADGWTQAHRTITEDATNHVFLIEKLRRHPSYWPIEKKVVEFTEKVIDQKEKKTRAKKVKPEPTESVEPIQLSFF